MLLRFALFIFSGIAYLLSASQVLALPDSNFVGPYFSGSGNCAQCHNDLSDSRGTDISIVKDWSSSMMANSSRDPYWRAKVASELHRNPALSDEINEECSRCHTPMATETAKKDGTPIELFDDGFFNPENANYDHALDGVSCTLCHQIADNNNLGTLEGSSGNYSIETFTNAVDRPAYGQYSSPTTGPMRNQVQFTPKRGDHTVTSEVCATCHDLKTPFVDADGDIVSTLPESEFPEQMVYSEWNNSAYQTGGSQEMRCQDCHMPAVNEAVKISNRPVNLAPRNNFARHRFLGANTTMMSILAQNRDALEVGATDFSTAIADTRAFLQTSADIRIATTELLNNQLKVTLDIINNSGHKLPSAYPSRRVFIHFVLRDRSGEILFESGKLNTDGSIVGADNDSDSATYEPHYEQISTQDQVQIYEPIMQNTDNQVTHTLLRAASYIKDNRLTPAGFDKASAPNDVAVVGAALNDVDFNAGSDSITYLIDVGEIKDFSIEAELKYQTLSYGHLQDLFADASAVPEIAIFKTLFEAAEIRSETLATTRSNFGITDNYHVIPIPAGKAVIFNL